MILRSSLSLQRSRSSRRLANADLVQKTTQSVLAAADEVGAESLALPAFGTGVGGFSIDECARLMVSAVREHEPRTL